MYNRVLLKGNIKPYHIFRYWDDAKKQYINTEMQTMACTQFNYIDVQYVNKSTLQNQSYTEAVIKSDYDGAKIIAEQCLGKKDKNGTYIYVGDILVSDKYKSPFFIIYDKDNMCFGYKQYLEDKHFSNLIKDFSDYKIIGNINENPKLVTKVEQFKVGDVVFLSTLNVSYLSHNDFIGIITKIEDLYMTIKTMLDDGSECFVDVPKDFWKDIKFLEKRNREE